MQNYGIPRLALTKSKPTSTAWPDQNLQKCIDNGFFCVKK